MAAGSLSCAGVEGNVLSACRVGKLPISGATVADEQRVPGDHRKFLTAISVAQPSPPVPLEEPLRSAQDDQLVYNIPD